MKIPLPSGNFIYIGKQNQEIQLTKKSADLVRDDQGNVNGTVPSFSIENVEKYVNVVFSPNSYIRNFVFLFENIAEIQFPINYLTSRIKNGNFVVKRWDDDTVVWSDSATSPIKSAVGGRQSADELSWKGSGDFHFSTNITLLRSDKVLSGNRLLPI